jgi:molybdopterin-guanine dinucleotide biosynthesis protein A
MQFNSSKNERVISAILLAGGQSSRMGPDKALLHWHGRTLIEHLVAQMKELSDDVLVITGLEIRYDDLLDVPIFADEIKDCGPMGGLYTGLKRARYDYSLAVACDMPLVSRALMELLSHEIDGKAWAIVPEVQGHRVPTLAIYHKKCLPVIESFLAEGRTSLQALLETVPVKVMPESRLRKVDATLQCFTNLNRPEDLTKLFFWHAREER